MNKRKIPLVVLVKPSEIREILLKSIEEEKQTDMIYLRLKPSQKKRFKEIAKQAQVTTTGLARMLVLTAMEASPEELVRFLRLGIREEKRMPIRRVPAKQKSKRKGV